jgi:hypothetical protein
MVAAPSTASLLARGHQMMAGEALISCDWGLHFSMTLADPAGRGSRIAGMAAPSGIAAQGSRRRRHSLYRDSVAFRRWELIDVLRGAILAGNCGSNARRYRRRRYRLLGSVGMASITPRRVALEHFG